MDDARFELFKTEEFAEWYRDLDEKMRTKIDARLDLAASGTFLHSRPLGEGLFEFKWNDGTRVYYSRTKVGDADIVALLGGDKGSQKQDIPKARRLKERIEADYD
jgi:putative addiction module killer protein